MFNSRSHSRQYTVAAILGAAGGGLAVALAGKAGPKVKSAIMHRVMMNMQAKGISPAEM
jgi:hypothetical protein